MDTTQEDFPSGTLSLEDPTPEGTLSLTDSPLPIAVPPEIAEPRATKAHMGLGKDSPGLDVLTSGISNGQEDQLRQDLTQVHKASLRQMKMAALQHMAQQGASANMDEAKALLQWEPNPDPNTLFERNYAREYTTKVAQNESNTTQDALAQDPTKATEILDAAQDTVTKQESFKKITEDLQQRQLAKQEGQASILSEYPVSSTVTSMVTPFMSQLNLRNIAANTASLLPGNNLEEQVTYLWSLPPEQATKEFSEAINRLEAVSPADAETFAHAVLGFSNSERGMANIQPFLDATIIGGPVLKLAKLMRGGLKGNAPLKVNLSNTLEAIGDTEKAADVKAVETASAKLTTPVVPTIDRGYDPLAQKLDLTSVLPTWANPSTLATSDNLGSLSREAAARITGQLEQQNKLVTDTMENISRVSRTTHEELQAGLGKAKAVLESENRSILDSVLDVRNGGVPDFYHIPAEQTVTNVDYLSMNLGKGGQRKALENDLGFPLGPTTKGPESLSLKEFEEAAKRGVIGPAEPHVVAENNRPPFERIPREQIPVRRTGEQVFHRDQGMNLGYSLDDITTHQVHVWALNHNPKYEKAYMLWHDWRDTQANKKFLVDGKLTPELEADLNKYREGGAARFFKELNSPEPPKPTFTKNDIKSTYEQLRSETKLNAGPFLTAKEANFGEVVIGKPDATLFKSATEAHNYAQRELGLDSKQYSTVQGPGNKWYISIVKSVDETSPEVRGMPITTNNKNNDSLVNYWLGYGRTSADQVSQFIRNNRLIATTAPSEIHKLIKQLAKPIIEVQKDTSGYNPFNKSWDRLNRVLEYYRDFTDYSQPNSRGMFPKSLAQLEKDWKKVTGKTPTEKEQLAFWSAVKINDFDWMLRNYNLHRDLARQGVEHISFPHPKEEGIYTNPILGKVIENHLFPWDNPEDAVLAIYRNGEYNYTTKHSNWMTSKEGEETRKWMLQPNVKIAQIANPDDRPLKGVLDRNAHFVVSEDIQKNPLPVKLVDYNGGGHVIYPGEWYAKQPVVEQGMLGKWYHYGDKTIMNFQTRAQAERYIPKINEFRIMLRDEAPAEELDAFVQKYLPKDVDFWTEKFKGDNAILSLDHPIMMTQRNSTTFKTNPELKEIYRKQYGEDIISYPESSYNLMGGIDKSFMQERDGPLMSIKDIGSNSTPVYKLEKAQVLEPLFAMERGVYNAIKGLYLNDVKTASVEQWIKQYASILDAPLDKIQRNPYYQFYHGTFVAKNDNNYKIIQSAENARTNLKNFLRSNSEFGDDINRLEEEIYSGIYNKGIVGDRTLNYVAPKDWNTVKHPINFLRSAGSNLRFGYFNPIQYWVQAMGATNAVAISPIHGMPGTAASILHYFQMLGSILPEKVAEDVLDRLDSVASKIAGWRQGTLRESIETMDRLGFKNVGRETSWRDSTTDPFLFLNQHQLFLDKSYMFFNGGDRFNRLVSWHTAFHEWRWANPDAKLTARIEGELLNRADLLGLNMTRESNSSLQKGIMGPATQFQSFRMRLAEAMMSTRLTNWEKARAFTAASVMFGIPIAASGYGINKILPGGVFDFYEDMHKYALNKGIDVSSKMYQALHGGLLDVIGSYLTGANHEFSKRFGPGASPGILSVDTEFPYIHAGEMLTQDNGLLPLVMGPPGSMMESIAKKVLPLYAGIHSAVRSEQDQFAITNENILDIAREVSSVNAAYNGVMAWNYQKYVSRNKQVVADDMSKTDAVMMALIGTTRSDVGNMRTMQAIGKDEKDKTDFFSKLAAEEYRKMYTALDEGEFYKADLYLGNAKIYMKVFADMNENDQLKVLNQSTSEFGTLMQRVTQKFYDPTKMPPSKMPARLRNHFGLKLEQ